MGLILQVIVLIALVATLAKTLMVFIFSVMFMLLCMGFLLVMGFRNRIVFEARNRARYVIRNSTWTVEQAQHHLHEYDHGPTYCQMMWDFRKWTFAQFYPALSRLNQGATP